MSITLLAIGVFIIITLMCLILYFRYLIPLRPKEDGFKYVYVEKDGTVRDLFNDEIKYLKEDFYPTDGAIPYIKSRYSSKTLDMDISVYISRNRVPKRIVIKEVGKNLKIKFDYKLDENRAWGIFSKRYEK